MLFNNGAGYSAINTARSALSSFLFVKGIGIGKLPSVCRFMKGVFNLRPALPRNQVTWDVDVVLNYLRKLSPVRNLALKELTHKLVTLFALLSAQRGQTLSLLDIRNMTVSCDCAKFRLGEKVKQTKPGVHQAEICLKAYPPDRRLCPVTVLEEYILRTAPLREGNRLLISITKPHKGVSLDTIRRWIKVVLGTAGIDLSIFTPHSTRSAATSAAKAANIPLATILQTAGWSNDSTFRKYYDKPPDNSGKMSEILLKAHT